MQHVIPWPEIVQLSHQEAGAPSWCKSNNGTIISSTWNQNFRVWKWLSTTLLSRWRHEVTVPLTCLEVCLCLTFCHRFWWVFPVCHRDTGQGPESRSVRPDSWPQQAWRRQGPGRGQAKSWLSPSGTTAGELPAALPECHAVSLSGTLVEHITEWNLLNWLLPKSQNIFY